jgi:acetyl-CoA carboxylase biotin carboxyl carrier protein
VSLTAKDIAEIARLLDESKFASLDLTMGEFRLRIRRDGGWAEAAQHEPEYIDEAPVPAAAPVPRSGPPAGETDVRAPLLGNFFSAPRPGDPPFVAVGDVVGADTTIGIIEVMKLMNPIRAGVAGMVTALLAENGSAVEEGQPLIRVRAA